MAERLEVTLDIDRDGKPDRSALDYDPVAGVGDLSIWLDAGNGALEPSGKPTFVKNNLTAEGVVSFEATDENSLLLSWGCGGCSNDYETTLAIVHRDGTFMVGGYIYVWDTRSGAGTCEINYVTGRGFRQEGVGGEAVPIEETFTPVTLADWSDEHRPHACDLQ